MTLLEFGLESNNQIHVNVHVAHIAVVAGVTGISPGDLFVEVSQLFVSDSYSSS